MLLTQACSLGAYLNLEQVLCRFDESRSHWEFGSQFRKMCSRDIKAFGCYFHDLDMLVARAGSGDLGLAP